MTNKYADAKTDEKSESETNRQQPSNQWRTIFKSVWHNITSKGYWANFLAAFSTNINFRSLSGCYDCAAFLFVPIVVFAHSETDSLNSFCSTTSLSSAYSGRISVKYSKIACWTANFSRSIKSLMVRRQFIISIS